MTRRHPLAFAIHAALYARNPMTIVALSLRAQVERESGT